MFFYIKKTTIQYCTWSSVIHNNESGVKLKQLIKIIKLMIQIFYAVIDFFLYYLHKL